MTKKSTRPDAGGGYKRINENLNSLTDFKQYLIAKLVIITVI